MPLTNLTQVTGPGIQTNTNLQVNDGNFTGIITAVSFVGDGSGLTGVANTDFVVGTAITMGTANFTGNVSIGGTLTYEDVSNIDSVGLVTARDGLFIPDDKELKVGNTASSPDLKIYHNSSNNNSYITESGNGSFFIQGSNLYLTDDDGTNMLYAANNAGVNLYWGGGQRLLTSSAGISIPKDLDVDGHTNLDNVSVAGVSTFSGSVTVGQDLFIPDKIVHSGDPDTAIRFPTNDIITAETGGTERLRIDSSGRLLIGTTSSTAHTNAGNLQIGDYSAGGAGITINTTTSGSGNIYFGDSSSSIRRGRIEYDHSNDAFRHYTADSERFRIDSSGRVLIGTTTEGEASADNLTIADSGNSGISIRSGTSSWGSIFFSDATSGTGELSGAIEYKHNDNFLRFRTNALERLRITSAGQVNIGDAISGMNMGFGTQLLSAKSGTYSAGIFGSNGSALTALIVYADHASYAANLQDWRTVRSNNSAFNFLRCSSNSASDNEFFIGGDGVVYSDGGTTMQSPADYAEMFEWSDGNSSDEDRRGYTVVLDGNKVRIATSSDSTDNIIGVVSGNPAVLADNAWDRWAEKYQKDDYNCYVRNSDGDRILNSSYDDTQTYVPREDRKEWDAIGMVGKLRVRKGQQTGTRWLKMRNVSDSIEEWLVR